MPSSAYPTNIAGAIVKAFIVLAPGHVPSDALQRELLGHARARLGAAVAPREIDFVDDLPRTHTRSGKTMRRPLKNPPKNPAGVALSATQTRHFSESEDLL